MRFFEEIEGRRPPGRLKCMMERERERERWEALGDEANHSWGISGHGSKNKYKFCIKQNKVYL